MIVINNFYFLKDATAIQVSPDTINSHGETLLLQTEGNGTGYNIELYGCSDMVSEDYYLLTGITTDYNLTTKISSNGLYTYGIDGIAKLRVKLNSITSGSISVFGKITKGV